MTSQRHQYRNPPIEEALCEFQFAGGAEWDPLATPARIRERLAGSYRGKSRFHNVIAAAVHSPGQNAVPGLEMTAGPPRIQVPTEDGRRLVAVAPGVLSVHVLRPYSGWEDFRARIAEALKAYVDVCQPSGFTRAGVRYINRVSLKGETVKLDNYFRFLPTNPEGLPANVAAFLHRNELVYEDGAKIVLTFASIPTQVLAEQAFVLDLDVILEATEPKAIATAMSVADDLRGRERSAFEAIITDKLRAQFDAD